MQTNSIFGYRYAITPLLSALSFLQPLVPLGLVDDGIVALLNKLLLGLFDLIGSLFTTGIRSILFFESPYLMTGPNEAFAYNLRFALVLLPIVVAIGLFSMPFANRQKAALWRQAWRVIQVLVFVALVRPVLHVVLMLVNLTGEYVYPNAYDLTFAGQSLLDSLAAVGVTGIALLVGGYILSGISVLGILFLFFILFLREFLFTLVYQGFPILIVAWYLDWGPFRTSNHIATVVFRITSYLLLVGPLIALALQVGTTFGGGTWPPNGAAPPPSPDTTVDFWRQFAGWFMGIALAGVFGAKAAMMGGVSIGHIGRATSTSRSGGGTADRSTDRSSEGRRSLRGQARDTFDHLRHRVPSPSSSTVSTAVSGAKTSASETWNEITDRPGWTGAAARTAHTAGKWTTPKAKRATRDGATGVRYAATHLHESPMRWIQAGAEHYRTVPLISNEQRVTRLLDRQSSGRMTKPEIASKLGWSDAQTQTVLDRLQSDGHIELHDTGRNTVAVRSDRSGGRSSTRADEYSDRWYGIE